MSLPNLAIRRSVSVYIACTIAILLGAISFQRLPVDLLPDLEFPRITVMTRYTGVAPEEIETLITRRIEETVGSCRPIAAASGAGLPNSAVAKDECDLNACIRTRRRSGHHLGRQQHDLLSKDRRADGLHPL